MAPPSKFYSTINEGKNTKLSEMMERKGDTSKLTMSHNYPDNDTKTSIHLR